MRVVNPYARKMGSRTMEYIRRGCGCSTSKLYALASGAVCSCTCVNATVGTRAEADVHY